MSKFCATKTNIADLRVIERLPISDDRGSLSRIFCAQELKEFGWTKPVIQINHTVTKKMGTVRGMHFQRPPNIETKLVTCIKGEIWDVAVDLRVNSPTYLKWHAEKLSLENSRALLIPDGFAHGFQALTDDCELIYLHSAPYTPRSEAGISPLDPYLKITWPLNIFKISPRDSQLPFINDQFEGF